MIRLSRTFNTEDVFTLMIKIKKIFRFLNYVAVVKD